MDEGVKTTCSQKNESNISSNENKNIWTSQKVAQFPSMRITPKVYSYWIYRIATYVMN
jgi:hypothetical protein